jgi:DNA processing protein
MGEEHFNQVALSLAPGLGPVTIRQLISYCGSATEVLKAKPVRLRKIPGIGEKLANVLSSSLYLEEASKQLELAAKHEATVIPFTDEKYPQRLRHLENAPIVLYIKGQVETLNNPRTLGIVGTRKASDYGRRSIRYLMGQLKIYGPTIISGLAYGIDIFAHREALECGLVTMSVMGSSLDKIYPESHLPTAEKMISQGCLISELKFGTKAEFYHFPSRNRIIAGLSDALIVVEARKKGGALITAKYTRKFGRPCFAIPGPIDSPASNGCNELLQKGKARFLTQAEDIAGLLGWSSERPVEIVTEVGHEKQIINVLKTLKNGTHIDELCRKTSIPINKMAAYLLNMELQGYVKPLPGKKFVLVSK